MKSTKRKIFFLGSPSLPILQFINIVQNTLNSSLFNHTFNPKSNVHITRMAYERLLTFETLLALVALERSLHRMLPHVLPQRTRGNASVVALVTLVWPLSGVLSHHFNARFLLLVYSNFRFYRKYAHPFSEGSFLKILW